MPFFHSPFGFFIELIIVHAFEYILFDGDHHIILQFFFQFLLFKFLLLFQLLLLLPSLLDSLDILLILLLEVFIGLGKLALCYFDQRLKLLGRVASDQLFAIIALGPDLGFLFFRAIEVDLAFYVIIAEVLFELVDPFLLLLLLQFLRLPFGLIGLVQRLQEDKIPLLVVLLLGRALLDFLLLLAGDPE